MIDLNAFKKVRLLFGLVASFCLVALTQLGQASMTADAALKLLKEGNLRFSQGKLSNPNQDVTRRTKTADQGQKPFAIILSCSDSRVPLELIFDRGIGDIFGIRVAGNVAGTDQMGTIEYGVEHLGIPLLIVLGHTKCGAVTAVVEGEHAHGNLGKLVEKIVPAVETTKKVFPKLPKEQLVDKCAMANVRQVIHDLTNQSPPIKQAIQKGQLRIVGGYYDIRNGRVDWIEGVSKKDEASSKD
ncbi:MAG: carbonic anhydrase [Desulfomonilaceae bacterium]